MMLQTETGKHAVDRNIKQADSELKMIMQKNANMAYHDITGNQTWQGSFYSIGTKSQDARVA